MRLLLAATLLPLPVLAQGLTVTDGAGREVLLAAPPERIACFLINCAEELAFIGGGPPVALGASVREVMVSSGLFGNLIDDIAAIPDADGIDLEALAATNPDLAIGPAEEADGIGGMAPLYVPNLDVARLDDLDLYLHDVRTLADLLGRGEEVEERIGATLERVEAYVRLAPPDAPRFATIYVVDDGRSFWISPGCIQFLREVVDCAHPGGDDWIQAGPELLLSMDPDVLVVDDYANGEAELIARLVADDPIWSGLTAARNGRIHLVDGNLNRMRTIGTVGPGLDALMPLLYPDAFPAPLTHGQVAAALLE